MTSLWLDVRQTVRALARSPGFVVAAALSLALGLGVNTAIFSVMNSLLLKPPAVRDLDRTVYVYHSTPDRTDRGMSFPAFLEYRRRSDTFSAAMAFAGSRPLLFGEGDGRETIYAQPVAGDFSAIARITLDRGRPFDKTIDDAKDPQFTVILSHQFWQRRFASDPGIVGSRLVLNGRSFTVSGVSGPDFTGLDPEMLADVWIPVVTWAHLMLETARLTGEEHWLTFMATLQNGVSLQQAQAVMAAVGAATQTTPNQQTKVRSIRDRLAEVSTDALAMAAAAFAVGLLILALACTNVVNLVIARAAARQREMSVRMAIGGARWRVVRLWVIEAGVVSLLAAVASLFAARWLLDLAVSFRPPLEMGEATAPPLAIAFKLDWRVFAFALGLAALTALAIGIVSGLQSSNPRAMLQGSASRASDRRFAPGFNLRSFVLASQMALSIMLLIPCGLFVRSAANASGATPGFSTENVLLLPISTKQAGMRLVKPEGFEQQLITRVGALPGVITATAMDPVPLWFGGNTAHFTDDRGEVRRLDFARIAPGYFETLRIPLLQGRAFTTSDTASSPRVVIVNETLARQLSPTGSAVGRQLRGFDGMVEVIGVAKDVKYLNLAETARPWIYMPLTQEPTDNIALSLAVRFDRDTPALRDGIKREVRALVPDWPAFEYRSLGEGMALQRQVPRVGAMFLGGLGVFGLLLASVGIYGVTAYVVKQRTREIGIRLALGSPVARVTALVIRQGMRVSLMGAGIGLVLAFAAAQFLTSVLVGVSAADPIVYLLVPTLLAAVALLACYLPARRVASTNPLEALREE